VQDLHVGCKRPHAPRQRRAELRFNTFGVVAIRQADSVCDPQHMAIDWQSRDAKRMAKHDVGRLPSNAGQRRQRVHV
jgi:hypothetical protein